MIVGRRMHFDPLFFIIPCPAVSPTGFALFVSVLLPRSGFPCPFFGFISIPAVPIVILLILLTPLPTLCFTPALAVYNFASFSRKGPWLTFSCGDVAPFASMCWSKLHHLDSLCFCFCLGLHLHCTIGLVVDYCGPGGFDCAANWIPVPRQGPVSSCGPCFFWACPGLVGCMVKIKHAVGLFTKILRCHEHFLGVLLFFTV